MWPKWLRTLVTLWVALDGKKNGKIDFFWVVVVFLLGPLLIPFYLAFKAISGEKGSNASFFCELFWSFEKLFAALAALAAGAVLVENFSVGPDKNLAEVKRAEIKAGSIVGFTFFLLAIAIERVLVSRLKNQLKS